MPIQPNTVFSELRWAGMAKDPPAYFKTISDAHSMKHKTRRNRTYRLGFPPDVSVENRHIQLPNGFEPKKENKVIELNDEKPPAKKPELVDLT